MVDAEARVIDLRFYNAGYAEGLRDMTYRLRTLMAEPSGLVLIADHLDRMIEIAPLSLEWTRIMVPRVHERLCGLMQNGLSIDEAMEDICARLASGDETQVGYDD